MVIPVTFALISLIVIALYSALERAMLCSNKLKIEVDKKQERRYAVTVDRLSQTGVETASSLYIGRTLALLVFGLSLAFLMDSIFIGILISAIFVVIIAEIIPFAVSTINPDFVLENFYWFADFSQRLFSPLVKKRRKIEGAAITQSEDISMFQNALNFSEVVLRECMVPRTEVCAVPEDSAYEDLLDKFTESNYSRILVYRENIDRIIGYIHSKDLFNGKKPIAELLREIDYLPETASAQTLLAMFTKSKRSIAVVLDEYGGTAGIVTLEDLIEEIFGEISDELDKEEFIEKKISDNEYIFSARIEVKYLNRTYDLMLPESDEYETLAGLLTFFHESIPSEGDLLEYENLRFKILKTTSNRVETVALRIVEE